MTQELLAGDLHLGSRWAAKHRGFTSVKSHDEYIMLELYNAVSRDKDTTLYVLGDAGDTWQDIRVLRDIRCKLILIMGNHDTEAIRSYDNVFHRVSGMLERKGMVMTHCPIHPQEMYRYTVNIHGHIHGHRPQLQYPYFNVNWDMWGRPVCMNYIKQWTVQNES